MKKFISITLFILLSFNDCFCQQLNWVKEHLLNDNGYHFGKTVSTDKKNNIYCSSFIRYYGTQYIIKTGSYIRKYNPYGTLIWEVFKPNAEVWGLATDENGNSYITGDYFVSLDFGCGGMYDTTQRPMFLAKLDSNGVCLWSKEIKNAYGSKIVMDKSGSAIYVTGGNKFYGTQFGCPSPSSQGFHYVSKYDSDGNCLWLKPTLTWQYISGIAVNDKYVAVTGRFDWVTYFGMDSSYSIGKPYVNFLFNQINNIYTALYDLQGNLKWAKVTGDYSDDVNSNSIALDDSNNVYVAGNYYNKVNLAGRYYHVLQWQDIFLVKYNEQGDTVLTTTWPGTNSEEGRAIYANKNGIYFSGGGYDQITIADTTINSGTATIVLAKLSFDLKHAEWVKTFASPGGFHSEIFQITSDSQNNIIACGDYTGSLQVDSVLLSYNNSGYKKPFIISIKELSPIVLSVPEKVDEQSILTIYPNPSGSIFNVSYENKNAIGNIQLEVKNIIGISVYKETINSLNGSFNTELNLQALSKGTYFIEVTCLSGSQVANKKREVKKMVLE